jgi:hypothetical protein
MRFLAVQTDPVWHDVAENRRRIEGAVDASGFGAGDYVVLPEMCETAWTTDVDALARAAFGRLPESLALTWTRRYWTQLEKASRDGTGGLIGYDGSRPIRLWIVEDLIGALERERAAGRLEIRREHIGKPLPLRLVGEQLA